MTHKLYKFLPAGQNAVKVKNGLLSGLISCCAVSLFVFLHRFITVLNSLYYYDDTGKRYIDIDAYKKVYDFEGLTENSFFLFNLFFICLAVIIIYNFIYHFIGSKSIYTMLRVGRGELVKRCVAVPLITVAVSLLSIALLYLLFMLIYILFVPELHI